MGKNMFGGGNEHSLYTPMSETEQEVLSRLIESADLEVHIVDWGIIHQPKITFGDLRLQINFQPTFSKPEIPQNVWYFDLELRTRSGLVLYRERQPTVYGGKPIQICNGVCIAMVWDIAIQKMDPKIVKLIKPKAIGLTTRDGNRALKENEKKALHQLRQGEKKVREESLKKALKATLSNES